MRHLKDLFCKPTIKIPQIVTFFFIKLFSKTKTSHSSRREDNIIDILTGQKEKGFYIDIGANDPDEISNTKLFYDRGWNGINIEPDIDKFSKLVNKRSRDININTGIGEGEATYYEIEGTTGNSFIKDFLKDSEIKNERKIKLTPLSDIFRDNGLTKVDFISIDVEGFEMEVLKSNDWSKYNARIICLEGKGYRKYLKQFGYALVWFDGLNSYYKLK